MKQLSEILEDISDNYEVYISFVNGDCFGLSDFEMVDESIYNNTDMCLSDIISLIEVSSDAYSTNNKLEFSINDVLKIVDPASGDIIYERNS